MLFSNGPIQVPLRLYEPKRYSICIHPESDCCWVEPDDVAKESIRQEPLVEVVKAGLDFMQAVQEGQKYSKEHSYTFTN